MPVAFGEFRNDPPLRKICAGCNEHVGKLIEVLSHRGVEAIRRTQLGVEGRKTHRRKDVFYEGTAGQAPIPISASPRGGGPEILWRPLTETGGELLTQLVVRKEDGNEVTPRPFEAGRSRILRLPP
jgi:hypothetical protein